MSATGLLIDFGGTLDADGEPWNDRFFAAYRAAGGSVAREAFGRAFATSDTQLAALSGVATFDYSGTVAAQASLLAKLLPDGGVLEDPDVQETFCTAAANVAGRNRKVLNDLSATYLLAVVSNFQGNLAPCLDELGLADVFDVVADSEVIGARKPARRIFDETLDQLGCDAPSCWMIGDSPPNDIAAAAALGMDTCWVAPAGRPLPGITPTARVARFSDVPKVLT